MNNNIFYYFYRLQFIIQLLSDLFYLLSSPKFQKKLLFILDKIKRNKEIDMKLIRILLAFSLCVGVASADSTLDGEWVRVAGGSSKIMTFKDNEGDFNVKWMNTYDYIRSVKQLDANHWSCEMIHNNGPQLFWERCEMELSTDGKLQIADKYAKHIFIRKQ